MHRFARLLSALPLAWASALALAQTPVSFDTDQNASKLNLSGYSGTGVQADLNNDGKPDLSAVETASETITLQ